MSITNLVLDNCFISLARIAISALLITTLIVFCVKGIVNFNKRSLSSLLVTTGKAVTENDNKLLITVEAASLKFRTKGSIFRSISLSILSLVVLTIYFRQRIFSQIAKLTEPLITKLKHRMRNELHTAIRSVIFDYDTNTELNGSNSIFVRGISIGTLLIFLIIGLIFSYCLFEILLVLKRHLNTTIRDQVQAVSQLTDRMDVEHGRNRVEIYDSKNKYRRIEQRLYKLENITFKGQIDRLEEQSAQIHTTSLRAEMLSTNNIVTIRQLSASNEELRIKLNALESNIEKGIKLEQGPQPSGSKQSDPVPEMSASSNLTKASASTDVPSAAILEAPVAIHQVLDDSAISQIPLVQSDVQAEVVSPIFTGQPVVTSSDQFYQQFDFR